MTRIRNSDQLFYFQGEWRHGKPFKGRIQCILGDGIFDPDTNERAAHVLYRGYVDRGVIDGRARMHVLYLHSSMSEFDRIWIGTMYLGSMLSENLYLTDVLPSEMKTLRNYVRENRDSFFGLTPEHILYGKINRINLQDIEELRQDVLWKYARSIVTSVNQNRSRLQNERHRPRRSDIPSLDDSPDSQSNKRCKGPG